MRIVNSNAHMKSYKAPWSTSLVVTSSVVTAVCIGVSLLLLRDGHTWHALLPLLIVFGGLLFTIRGYTVTSDAILVHRLLWSTRVPLSGCTSAEVAPEMSCGIRLFGNGGLFSFSGWFRNRALGTYRSFVTDPHRRVVLRYSERPVVVSPASPDEFVHDIGASRQAA